MLSTAPLWLLSWLLPAAVTQTAAAQTTPPAAKIAWSAARPLTWDDFRARPNTDRLEALTSSAIDATIGCVDYRFSGQVQATFAPAESWVRNAGRATPTLLRHEQLHFDLTEVHARLLRQKLTLVKFNCQHLQPAFNNLTKAAFLIWQREEARYDQETNHGLNAAKQQEWDQKTQQRLQELAAYAERAGG